MIFFRMVRNYIRKTNRAAYTEEIMAKAINDIKSKKLSLRKASKKYGIAISTLHKRIKKNQVAVENIGRYKPTFNREQEEEFKNHILSMERLFYGICPTELRRLAFEFAEVNNISHQFNNDKRIAGKQWAKNFMSRVGGLSIRTPEATSMARISGFSRSKVQRFFNLLQELQLKYHFKPDRIFNLDETGVTVVQRPKKIIAQKGKKQVGRATSAERGKTATVVASVNAFGSFIPPVLIYKRVRMNPHLLNGAIPGTIGIPSPTGWIDTDIYFKVMQHFIKSTRATKDDPTLLIVDGHSSHKSLKAVNLCRENGIVVITLPPHCTNNLQPLDLTVFGPFKSYLNSEMDIWMTNHPGERITEYDMGPLICNAFMKAATPNNICSGFRKSGIYPFNPDVFSDADFAAADAVNARQDEAEKEIINNETGNENENPAKHVLDNSDGNISVSELLPLPKAQHKPAKKTVRRVQQKSEVITSTPYKDYLVERQEQKSADPKKVQRVKRNICEGEAGVSGIKPKKKEPKKQKVDATGEDCECIYCGGKFSQSAEEWVLCAKCGLWSHEECTDVEPYDTAFFCDFCRH